jgi:hypothetical protein
MFRVARQVLLSGCCKGRAWLATKTIPTPYMADSITQGTLGSWEKKVGDMVKQDELVANIETDKVHRLIDHSLTTKFYHVIRSRFQ